MKVTGTLIIISFLIVGCQGDRSNNISPLLGNWITNSCEQASDSGGSPINKWLVGLFEFTPQGTIRFGHKEYADSDCVTLNSSVAPANGDIPVMYNDKGPQTLQEGIEGDKLLIEMGSGDQFVSREAYYTINDGKLCFSDAFTFEALKFGISESGADAIDFSHCLVRP